MVKYLVCVILLIDLYNKKRINTLVHSVITTFVVISLIDAVNFILSLNNSKSVSQVFHHINYIDSMSILLIVNLFVNLKKKQLDQQSQ